MIDVLNLEKSILRIHVINHVFNYLKRVIQSFTITNFSFIIGTKYPHSFSGLQNNQKGSRHKPKGYSSKLSRIYSCK